MSKELTKEVLYKELRQVVDPELHINIVDLGLIYDITVDEQQKVHIDMTLTSPACPYGPMILYNVRFVMKNSFNKDDVDINVVWDPPWSAEHMSEEARLELGYDV